MLEGQGASVALSTKHERWAAVVDVPGQTAWARVFLRGLKLDLRPLQHLDIELKHVAGEAQDILVALLDAQNREATLRTATPAAAWATRRLDLGDLRADPGFDPAQVTTLQLVWKPAQAQVLAIGTIAFVAGPAGWRHPPEEQARRVFGPQRAREVKGESSAHFEIWSDDAKALKAVGAALEADAAACAVALGAAASALDGLKLPLFVFKQASDYQDYCARALGWTKEQARRSPAAGGDTGLVFYAKAVGDPQLRHRLGKAIFDHVYGPGGGAWLQDGAGEHCVRRLQERPITKELAPRLKTNETWPLADLVRASSLHGGERADATFDYRPIYLHAASVVEYLLREAPKGGASGLAPQEAIAARLKALAAIRAEGRERVDQVEAVLGQSLDAFDVAYRAWAAKAR
jgi:hypothetical protein